MFFDIYTLPYLVIDAGQESRFQFGVVDSDGNAVQNSTYTCDVVEFCNEGAPVASWGSSVSYDPVSKLSTIALTFSEDKTMKMGGKYIYQITVKLSNGSIGEIGKGILFVRHNINPV